MNENIRQEYVEKFKNGPFEEISKEFRNKWTKSLARERETLLEQIKRQLRTMLRELLKIQTVEALTAGCVEISLLRTSFYFKKPQLCIEIYDYKQSLGNCILESRQDIPFFYELWQDYYEELKKVSTAFEWARFITDEVIYTLMQEALDHMAMGMAFLLKYNLEECHEWKELKELEKTELFFISAGGYRDWQKIVFAERAPFDIFIQDKETSLRYGRFDNQVYYRKEMEALDLKGSCFQECQFQHSVLEDIYFNDCTFIQCKFINTTFQNVHMPGTVFEQCSFINCSFEHMEWSAAYDFTAEEIEDCYRLTTFQESKFLGCGIEEKDLEGCQIANTCFDKNAENTEKLPMKEE